MEDDAVPGPREADLEIHRVCSVLESIASQYRPDSAEATALRDAALAYIAVRQHQALKRAYEKLKGVHQGELPAEMEAKLRELGCDLNNLENDE